MADHAEVFISATTRDLGSYRREIKDALLSLQIFPIEESTFTLAYGPLTEMLRDLIGRCDAVIHLVGFYYGAEPPQRPVSKPRRSYTQIEYDVARQSTNQFTYFLPPKAARLTRVSRRATENKRCSLLTVGTLLRSAVTFTSPSPTTTSSEPKSANCGSQPAMRRHRAER